MNNNPGHAESGAAALFLVGILAIIDVFINVADGHPAKIICYSGLYVVLYLIVRAYFRRNYLKD